MHFPAGSGATIGGGVYIPKDNRVPLATAQALLERFTETQALYLQKLLCMRAELASRSREEKKEAAMT